MLIKKFPVPCRVDYVPSPYEPDEDGVQDVGYYNGKLIPAGTGMSRYRDIKVKYNVPMPEAVTAETAAEETPDKE